MCSGQIFVIAVELVAQSSEDALKLRLNITANHQNNILHTANIHCCAQIAIVSQEPTLFSSSIFWNIACSKPGGQQGAQQVGRVHPSGEGKPQDKAGSKVIAIYTIVYIRGAESSLEEVTAAAIAANAHSFIAKLPQG